MSDPVKPPRSYSSPRRQAQATETRRASLSAAHDLFVEHGYGRTTIAEIAATAGVSVETVYATFKNKSNLLHRVWDVTVGGDDEQIVFHERPEVSRSATSQTSPSGSACGRSSRPPRNDAPPRSW